MIGELVCAALLFLGDDSVPTPERPPRGFLFVLEQDLFFPPENEDRDYTQGLALEWHRQRSSPHEEPSWFFDGVHGWLDRKTDSLWLGEGPGDRQVSAWAFGALAYTPDDLATRGLVSDDRPYASLLYMSHKNVVSDEQDAVGTELRFGVLGLRLAENVQSRIHSVLRSAGNSDDPVDPKGWGNQISDGGEPTLLYRASANSLLAGQPGSWDLALLRDVNLGYQTNAGLGLGVRTGTLESGLDGLPDDPIGRAVYVPALQPGDTFFWAATRARAVAYNALLQGQFRHSDYEVPSGDVERLVLQAGVGFSMSVAQTWQLSIGFQTRSRETDQPKRWHTWGGILVSGRY